MTWRTDCSGTPEIMECGSVWLEHLLWEQGVASSNLVIPIAPSTLLLGIMATLELREMVNPQNNNC